MQVLKSRIVCFLNFFLCFSQHSSQIAMCSVRQSQKASLLSAFPFFKSGWFGQGLTIKSESPIKRSSFFGIFPNASLPSKRNATGSPIIPTFYLVCKQSPIIVDSPRFEQGLPNPRVLSPGNEADGFNIYVEFSKSLLGCYNPSIDGYVKIVFPSGVTVS